MQGLHPLLLPVLTVALLAGPCSSAHAGQHARVPLSEPPGTDAQQTSQSCREIAARTGHDRDGRYWLRLHGQPVQLYCHDMAGEPREYLELPQGNCSEYASNKHGPTEMVQTCFRKVRIDPDSLRVDVSDLRFAQTHKTGRIAHDRMRVDAMPYATAMACDAPGVPAGRARITLTGTGFAVVDSFHVQGYLADGLAQQLDGSGQQWELQGGGYCGWIAPGEVYNPMFAAHWNPFDQRSGYLLQLRFVGDTQQDRRESARCWWMENYSGQYQWIPADPVWGKALSKAECFALDSCNGGGGRSGGGCYQWADTPD